MSDIEYVMVMHDGNRSTKFMSEDYCKDLMEQLAAAQSQEVCTVAHDNVETCGYCQRDALAARLAEAERDAARYRWLRNTTNWPWSVRAATGEDFDLAVDYCLRTADTAPACLGRNVKDEPLPRCEAYPKCPCGGLEGWTDDSAAGEKHE